ncbi:hypothetical protein HBI55_200770 [Parastagonospora nodorum]|nr:hypothetical protein HBI15_028310 [Parastagonospora nodorum]KAH6485449.1 hypothetical protein HBI55_200770 [Parastagonospora nodorum]
MFRWYKDAARCYVHLRDVCLVSDLNQTMSSLHSSRWFTRSWTLQELLAPESVEFFDSEGNRIGDRVSLMAQLHDITKIPQMALQGSPLSKFSVEDRMSWTLSRSATRAEDQAYSLLGIFDVHMPLLYGEGERMAFRRLRNEIEWSMTRNTERNRRRATLRPSTSFRYGVLAANGFRLLTLQPGQRGSEIARV